MKHLNKPADLSINYKVKLYEQIEQLFDLKDDEQPIFHLILALMGYKNNKKIELNTNDNKSDKSRDFSLRTVYPRNESDLDSYYGLLAILDNLEKPYDEVIEKIAFERTSMNGTPFLKMKNVKTFYEYMLGGLEYFEEHFLLDGTNAYRVAINLDNFLLNSNQDVNEILVELMIEEENT